LKILNVRYRSENFIIPGNASMVEKISRKLALRHITFEIKGLKVLWQEKLKI